MTDHRLRTTHHKQTQAPNALAKQEVEVACQRLPQRRGAAVIDDNQATESDGALPAGWSAERAGVWGSRENEIRLAVHYSKATRRYTALAKSGEFFLTCSLLGDLQTAVAEAVRLGELLRLRLEPAQSVERAAQ